MNPAGTPGGYLMRHCNAILMGWFARKPAPRDEFHKHIGIHDFYFGHPSVASPAASWDASSSSARRSPITSSASPAVDRAAYRRVAAGGRAHGRADGAARDRPANQRDDRDCRGPAQPGESRGPAAGPPNRFGMPIATITHRYDGRDTAARDALVGAARRILRERGDAGDVSYNIQTSLTQSARSGWASTCRDRPSTSGAYRGLDNLFVTDGSALPRSGGVNPSDDRRQCPSHGTHIAELLCEGRGPWGRVSRDGPRGRDPQQDAARDCARGAAVLRQPRRRPSRSRCRSGTGAGDFADYAAAIESPEVAVVLVALPPAAHLEWTLRALAARNTSSSRRPFLRSADFDQVAVAASAGRQVLVAENYYKPLAGWLRKIIQDRRHWGGPIHSPERVEGPGDGQLARRSVAGRRRRAVRRRHPLVASLSNIGLTPARIHAALQGSRPTAMLP